MEDVLATTKRQLETVLGANEALSGELRAARDATRRVEEDATAARQQKQLAIERADEVEMVRRFLLMFNVEIPLLTALIYLEISLAAATFSSSIRRRSRSNAQSEAGGKTRANERRAFAYLD